MLNLTQRQRGLTLIELIVAIVILGGAMVSMAAVMQANARSSASASRLAQAMVLARGVLTRLDSQPFANLPACDPTPVAQALSDGAGNPVTGYSASLLVSCPSWPNVTTATDIKQLTLTVNILAADDGGTLDRVQLDSYRANYPAGKVTRLP